MKKRKNQSKLIKYKADLLDNLMMLFRAGKSKDEMMMYLDTVADMLDDYIRKLKKSKGA